MTDGIIQEVFNTWKQEVLHQMKLRKLKLTDRIQEDYATFFNVINVQQQELIEKIKQVFRPDISCGCDLCESVNNYCRRLIGDNQE